MARTQDDKRISYTLCPAGTGTAVGGGKGVNLARLVITVTTAATATVTLADGADAAVSIMPANPAIGCYSIAMGHRSRTGAWTVTCGAGASAIAIGDQP